MKRNWIKVISVTAIAIASMSLTACSDSDDDGSTTSNATASNGAVSNGATSNGATSNGTASNGATSNGTTSRSLELTFSGLPALGAEYVYEGWIIVDGAPVSTGRFTVNGEGVLDPATFSIDTATADNGSMFVLTIEPATGDDPAPADTHVLAGGFEQGSAVLTIDHMAALGSDFTDAAGTFILATPTSTDETDNAQGIWFLDPSGAAPVASLSLPVLPAGWVYEGWVVDVSGDNPMPISTGTFTGVDGADSDAGGPGAGDQGAPPFPGQDFITPARDLTSGHAAVISIEPSPDDSPNPFQLKPLFKAIGTDIGGMSPQTLDNAIADNIISGMAEIK